MARIGMVTRAIKTTEVTVLGLDIDTREVEHRDVLLRGVYKDESAILKDAKKALETDTFKIVSIVAFEIKEARYGMSEADFMAGAKIITEKTKEGA